MTDLSPEIAKWLDPEKVAYWYFRLNGFLQIENFVIHPEYARDGGQRTDADILAIRFPYRAERLYDGPGDLMPDDEDRLLLSRDLLDLFIIEITKGTCKLNGPWTDPKKKNIQRVLAAIGCLQKAGIDKAADDIYRTGLHRIENRIYIRLVALGHQRSEALKSSYPKALQLIWPEMLAFMWTRFHKYRNFKKDVAQWDEKGQEIKDLACKCRTAEEFIKEALRRM